MSLKVVFLFALVALAYGLPASPQVESDSQGIQEVPAELDGYLENLFPGEGGEASLTVEPHSALLSGDEVLTRHRRACRSVRIRTRSGRVITVRRC